MSPNMHKRPNDEPNRERAKRAKLTDTETTPIPSFPEADFPRGGGPASRNPGVSQAVPEKTGSPSQRDRCRKSSVPNLAEGSSARRIDHLNYKRLAPGMKLLVRVVAIRPLCVIVSLPNQLLGQIPITQISSKYTSMLEDEEANADVRDFNAPDGEGHESSLSVLPNMVSEGQFVSATVLAIHPRGANTRDQLLGRDELLRASQRVELSILPSLVNDAISKENIADGAILLSAVQSIEDHGYLMELGLSGVDGFMPFTGESVENGASSSSLLQPVGSIRLVTVKERSDNGRTYQLSQTDQDIRQSILREAISADSITPGSLVHGLLIDTSPSGIVLQLFGSFEATADIFHTSCDQLRPGSKVKARILYRVPNSSPPKFAVSLLPHLLDLSLQDFLLEQHPVGTFVAVEVRAVLPEWGVVVRFSDGKVTGFVHISQLSDDHVLSVSATAGPYKVGSTHKARITGHHPLDQVLHLSFRKSVLERRFLQVSELHLGDSLIGRIKSVTDKAVFVAISGNVDGVIWPNHFADIMLRQPQRRFKKDSSLKCKVLVVEPITNRVILTAKKSLVESNRAILHSFSEARIGFVADAVVCKVSEKGLVVEFYNNLKAFAPRNEIVDTGETINFPVGMPVTAMIIGIDSKKLRLTASLLRYRTNPPKSQDSPKVGTAVTGFVAEVHAERATFVLQPSQRHASMNLDSFPSSQRLGVGTKLSSALARGEEIRDLIVVSHSAESLIVAPISNSNRRLDDIAFDEMAEGSEVAGRVVASGPKSAVVRLSKTSSGVLHITDCADDYSQCGGLPPIQSFVKAVIVGRDPIQHILQLSTRPSRMLAHQTPTPSVVHDPEITTLGQLSMGQNIRGFIQNLANHGLFVTIGRGLVARVQIRELFDEVSGIILGLVHPVMVVQYIQDWQSKFHTGDLVSGRIKSVDTSRGLVELTLRSFDTGRATRSRQGMVSLVVGQIVDGRVKRKEKYGIFIELPDFSISGLCHKTEVSDSPDCDSSMDAYHEGDAVKTIILSIDLERNRISFGLKPSYLNLSDVVHEEPRKTLFASPPEFTRHSQNTEILEDSLVLSDFALEPPGSDDKSALDVARDFDWTGNVAITEEVLDGNFGKSFEFSPARPRQDGKKDQVEVDHTQKSHTISPQSSADFERVLLGSPNSSYAWIRYASFHIQLSDFSLARETLRRALKTIHFREEQERFNIWVALLNLECTFGDDETVESVFQQAIKANDPKRISLRLASIYQQTGVLTKADEIYQRTIRKYAQSSKVWIEFAVFLFEQGNFEKARSLLPQSLVRLEKRKHVKVVAKFAQLEFKYGEPERGRTIFEGLLESYPKRMDLWHTFVDMEMKEQDLNRLRSIFNRILGMKLSAHRARSALKKWLAVEKQLGDEASVEAVKHRAQDWKQKREK